jgi:L-alanine-DL-glutamate epimerase-like enolase superfamily enzyme
MAAAIEGVRGRRVEAGNHARRTLQNLLPAGGARNALDCALWELGARRSGVPVHELAGLPRTAPAAHHLHARRRRSGGDGGGRARLSRRRARSSSS